VAAFIRSFALSVLVLGPVALLFGACASGPEGTPSTAAARAAPSAASGRGRAEDLLPVDCKLPPQIRQLGSRGTYI